MCGKVLFFLVFFTFSSKHFVTHCSAKDVGRYLTTFSMCTKVEETYISKKLKREMRK